MNYCIKKDSECDACSIKSNACIDALLNITDKVVFKNLGDGKLYVFVCDGCECFVMCEVEESAQS